MSDVNINTHRWEDETKSPTFCVDCLATLWEARAVDAPCPAFVAEDNWKDDRSQILNMLRYGGAIILCLLLLSGVFCLCFVLGGGVRP